MNSLTAKQRQAVQLIAQGFSRTAIAQMVGVDPGTLSRWRRLPDFESDVNDLLQETEREVAQTLSAVRLAAAERLCLLIQSPYSNVALKAVTFVLARMPPEAVVSRGAVDESGNAYFDIALADLQRTLS